MFQAGDIVRIPLPNGKKVIGRLLHISQHFENVVSFIVFGLEDNVDVALLDRTPHSGLMHTALEAIEHYGWCRLFTTPITEQDRRLTLREVGGGVYVEDEYLGTVHEVKVQDVKPMLVSGMHSVYRKIEDYLTSAERSNTNDKSDRTCSDQVQEGDIVEIPLPDGRTAIAWILHISQHFKDSVGFVVFGIKGQVSEDAVYDLATGHPVSMKVLGPLYTHMDTIKHYGWKALAHQPISESRRQWTKREVNGGVYVGDKYIGSIEEVGDANVKSMLAMGMPVIYSEIEKAFGQTESA